MFIWVFVISFSSLGTTLLQCKLFKIFVFVFVFLSFSCALDLILNCRIYLSGTEYRSYCIHVDITSKWVLFNEETQNEWRGLKTQIKIDGCCNVPRSLVTALSVTTWRASGILSHGEIKVGLKGSWSCLRTPGDLMVWSDWIVIQKRQMKARRGLEAGKNVYWILLCRGLLYAFLMFSISCFHEALKSSILSQHE